MSKCPELFNLCKLICSKISIQPFITAFLMQWSMNLQIILISIQQLYNLEQQGKITQVKPEDLQKIVQEMVMVMQSERQII
jgi:hypothetical protein|uniref:Uncharacterized protein n=1 Tax=Populus trichocarpa TaxID=3694 RepID=A0A2K1WZY8_POPTR